MNIKEMTPAPVSEQEKWIANAFVSQIRIECRQTGVDTTETYIHMKSDGSKWVCWHQDVFKKYARLSLGYNTIVEPVYGLKEKVEARLKYEKRNQKELSEYKRLKAKFEQDKP